MTVKDVEKKIRQKKEYSMTMTIFDEYIFIFLTYYLLFICWTITAKLNAALGQIATKILHL